MSTAPAAQRREAPRPPACSAMWALGQEPVWGSAAPAGFWLAVEQEGPWGAFAMTQSHLDRRLGSALERACATAGGRVLLIRSVGGHRDLRPDRPRRVLLSGGMGVGKPWLLSGCVGDPAALLAAPFADLSHTDWRAAASAVPELAPCPTPQLLVCANSKRDLCCAVQGRALGKAVAAEHPEGVWECTHTGGHRFAPTGVLLPFGLTLARMTTALSLDCLRAAGAGRLASAALSRRHWRGLSHLSPPEQAADAHVRLRTRETRLDALTTGPGDQPDKVTVRHRDGRSWSLRVRQETLDVARKNSCQTDPVPATFWRVRETAG